MMMKLVALVPMRHHSQRVPGKNYRLLAGKPLFHYILETLSRVPGIEQVVVDTDSSVIMENLREHFPAVKILERPAHLRADDIPMNEVLLFDTSQVESEFFLQTHSTNPLLKAETISRGVATFFEGYPEIDSLFSVTRLQTRLYDQHGRAINHDPMKLLQTQDLPPVYEENSCLYLFSRQNLERYRSRIGKNPALFEIDPAEAWDIDEELDFYICDHLIAIEKGRS
jgi:CMP-N-acetylneuraminic acid synthetase